MSIPDDGAPPLGALYLRAGRMPRAGASDEAVVLEQFAEAHHLAPGDRAAGRDQRHGCARSQLVGVALSPEYVLAMSGREMVADNRRFAVLWMLRGAIAPAFRMEGAFNDVVLRLEPGASLQGALDAVDRELARYGGRHAVPRAKQTSNYALSSELAILRIARADDPGGVPRGRRVPGQRRGVAAGVPRAHPDRGAQGARASPTAGSRATTWCWSR